MEPSTAASSTPAATEAPLQILGMDWDVLLGKAISSAS